MRRVIVYPKDIMILTGKSERYSREVLKKIKVKLNKKEHHLVSIHELCDYFGLNVEHVLTIIK